MDSPQHKRTSPGAPTRGNAGAIVSLALKLSLAANLALVYLVFNPASKKETHAPSPVESGQKPVATAISKVPLDSQGAGTKPLWHSLESTNYQTYVQNLRSIGCPEETIREIVTADIKKLYDERRTALQTNASTPYWKKKSPQQEASERQIERQREQLFAEERTVLGTLFGSGGESATTANTPQVEMVDDPDFGLIAKDKRDKVHATFDQFRNAELDVLDAVVGADTLPEDEQRLKDLQRQRDDTVKATLSPEELREFELRTSRLADGLRTSLDGVATTEAEFRNVFDVLKRQGADPAEGLSALPYDKQLAVDQELRTLLGDARFADYKLNQNPDYQYLTELTSTYGLDKSLAKTVIGVEQQMKTAREAIVANPNLDPSSRALALVQLNQNQKQQVTQLLGVEASKRYLQRGQTGR